MHRMTRTLVAALALLIPPAALASDADQKSQEVLKAAREALGGEEKLASIRTVTAKGKHRRMMGEMQIAGETEIALALPDKYVRSQTDTMMGNTMTREAGFNGETPLERVNSMGGGHAMVVRMGGPGGPGAPADPEARRAAMLRNQRAESARLTLGWLLSAPALPGATFTYAGEAESPDGRAHVIDVKAGDGFAARLFIDQQSSRPLMLTYMAPQPIVRVMRQGPGEARPRQPHAGADEIAREIHAQGPPPVVEHQLFFDDFREVDGVWLPHRISRSIKGEPAEELELEKIRINDDIKASTFEAK
ncbi:MAG TPA: hypothetical protein VK886_02950 [Vicinamibacterales bacterium]|nr:hypothetical protein [Vicinamibacterales bacterium]